MLHALGVLLVAGTAARVSASGKVGERVGCPVGELRASVSELGLDLDTSGLPRTCYVVLRAVHGGGGGLKGAGPMERQERRSLRWEAVEDLARGHMPAPGVLYRAGGTYFKVEV